MSTKSKREQIISALKQSLEDNSTNTPVFRSRVEPFSRGKTASIVIEPGKDVAASVVVPKTDWSLLVIVSVIVRGEIPDELADPIIQMIHEKIMADLSVGGLAMGIEPVSYEPHLLEGDKPVGIFENVFRVSYRTTELDITQ